MNLRSPKLLVMVACVLACEFNDAPRLDAEGDPCHTNLYARCLSDDTLLHCVDRRWVAASCTQACTRDFQAAVDGRCQPAETQIATCECRFADSTGCTPGELRCDGADAIEKCGDDQRWTRSSCAVLCEGVGPALGCEGGEHSDTGASPPDHLRLPACRCGD